MLEWRAKPVTGDSLDAVQGVHLSLLHGTDVARLSYVARRCLFVVVTCTWTNGRACVLAVSLHPPPRPPPLSFSFSRTLSLSRAPETPRASALSPFARVSGVCALCGARAGPKPS